MKLFLDCSLGVSGDMFLSSLLCHLKDEELFFKEMKKLSVYPLVEISLSKVSKNGIFGNNIEVIAKKQVQKRNIRDIISIIENSELSSFVKNNAKEVVTLLGQAESEVHGVPIDEVHFHEIGALDTIIDIVGTCVLMELLKVNEVFVSKINVGHGMINISHGTMSIPTMATTRLLMGFECFTLGEPGERVTPTGASLVRHFAKGQQKGIEGKLVSLGIGHGQREFSGGNYLKSILYESCHSECLNDETTLLECNIDDMTAEHLAFTCEVLINNGALDVWQTPIVMKKGRSGIKLSVLCDNELDFIPLIFKHTTTNGIRKGKMPRVIRGKSEIITHECGIRLKKTGDIIKPEFEDVKKEALNKGESLANILKSILEE